MNKALTAGLLCLVILGLAPTTSAKKLTLKEKREAQALADRFIRRFRETRDLRPLMAEFFVTDLRKSGLTDPFWGRSVNLDVPPGANLSDKELSDFYAVKFTVVYLSRLHLAGTIPLESLDRLKSEDFERLTPQTILDYSKTLKLPEREPPARDQAQLIYSIKDHMVTLLQQELAQHPPEETAVFKKNLASFTARLNDKRNRGAVRLLSREMRLTFDLLEWKFRLVLDWFSSDNTVNLKYGLRLRSFRISLRWNDDAEQIVGPERGKRLSQPRCCIGSWM